MKSNTFTFLKKQILFYSIFPYISTIFIQNGQKMQNNFIAHFPGRFWYLGSKVSHNYFIHSHEYGNLPSPVILKPKILESSDCSKNVLNPYKRMPKLLGTSLKTPRINENTENILWVSFFLICIKQVKKRFFRFR